MLVAAVLTTSTISAALPFPTPTATATIAPVPSQTATETANPTVTPSSTASGTPTTVPGDLIVNTLSDHDDGACTVIDCTLREAINAANSQPGPQTLGFSVTGTILLAVALGPLPAIAEAVTIDGPGADNLTVDANGTGSVLVVNSSVTADISGLTLTGGQSDIDGGGGILNRGSLTLSRMIISGNEAIYGGGIYNPSGVLVISGSTIRSNDSFYYGSGIWSDGGALTLTDSTVSDNNAHGYRTGGIVSTGGHATLTNSTVNGNVSHNQGAGGILNWAATSTLINSTVSGNTGSGYGGGISNVYSGTVTLTNSTVSGNGDTSAPGGGILNDSGTTTLRNTIVANDSPADCFGAIATLGHNLASDASCALGGTGDMNSTNPLLGPLANNGGPTETHALQPGSPAIDAGDNAGCPIDDQRGVARPYNSICDIGAYEYTGVIPTTTGTPTAAAADTASPSPPPTATDSPTGTETSTPEPTATTTSTPTVTASPTETATETPSPQSTETVTSTPTVTPVPSYTASETASSTATPTTTVTATRTSTTSTPSETPTKTVNTATSTRSPTRTPTPPACDLAISKSINPTLVPIGGQVTVTLSVTNLGFGACAPPITVSDLPQSAGVVLVQPVVVNPSVGWQCVIGLPSPLGFRCTDQTQLLAPHATVTFTVNAIVLAAPGSSINNCGTVAGPTDPNATNNQACTTVNVAPLLSTRTATNTSTATPTATPSNTRTATRTSTSTRTAPPTPRPTSTQTDTPTNTPTNMPTQTSTPVNPCPGTPADGTTCDAGTDSAQTMIFIGGACVPCAAAPSAAPRFVDNCNGTITDRLTCLVWEKKDDAGGLHDKDNTYQWCLDADNNGQCDSPGFPPDGGAFTAFIAGLNSAGFAGHHDWRIPNEDGRNGSGPNELESILALPCSAGSLCVDTAFNTNCGLNSSGNGGCTVDGATSMPECSCTQAVLDDEYWSATTAYFPTIAWEVVFNGGHVGPGPKPASLYVRAVRGGL